PGEKIGFAPGSPQFLPWPQEMPRMIAPPAPQQPPGTAPVKQDPVNAETLPLIGSVTLPSRMPEPAHVAAARAGVTPAVLTVRAMFPRPTASIWQPRAAPPAPSAEAIVPASAVLLAPETAQAL